MECDRGRSSSLSRDLVGAVNGYCREIADALLPFRRDLHRWPELGWTELRTTALVITTLLELGFEVRYGRELYGVAERVGLPDADVMDEAWAAAQAAADRGEIDAEILGPMKGGYTGCVATWRTGRPGPTLAFRVDIDALPVMESTNPAHRPAAEGWASARRGTMHACGHDVHTAIGVGLAQLVARLSPELCGEVRLLFQPAEEGGRGAAALVDAGGLEGVDRFVALHVGLGAPEGTVATSVEGLLATSKFEVTFQGVPAHAGRAPEKGRNALLAAAGAALNLHTHTQFSMGQARLNVGMLNAGTALNIVPDRAVLAFEVRGENKAVHQAVEERALRTVRGAGAMHDVEVLVRPLGRALATPCDMPFAEEIATVLQSLAPKVEVSQGHTFGASEDASLMMDCVQRQGGVATLGVIGAALQGDHHQPNFDVADSALAHGLLFFAAALLAYATGSGSSRLISSTR